jgi:hypothetical protein
MEKELDKVKNYKVVKLNIDLSMSLDKRYDTYLIKKDCIIMNEIGEQVISFEQGEQIKGSDIFINSLYLEDGCLESISDTEIKTREEADSQLQPNCAINIAYVCHQANKSWCELNGDTSQKDWYLAEQWQRDSAIAGVKFRFDNPSAKEDAQHNAWMADKIKDGWVYGEVKDAEKKIHPCLVPFEELPVFQQKKDALFCAIVDALK